MEHSQDGKTRMASASS